MSVDFQQVRKQVKELGERALERQQELDDRRQRACQLLDQYAGELEWLEQKAWRAIARDQDLRCALPFQEPLNARCPVPALDHPVTLLAADGSQIAPERSAEVEYCLINVGAVMMRHGAPTPPAVSIQTRLFYGDQLETQQGMLTDTQVNLLRDLDERAALASLAESAQPPVITFTDGPLELWGAKESGAGGSYADSLEQYKNALARLCAQGAATAGYVDKPAANLVVRLLEIASLAENQLAEIGKLKPLRGVRDDALYRHLLQSGERSAVFALHSQSYDDYTGHLALHFFYLNVGLPGHAHLSRVEIPAWVAEDAQKLNALHAVLVSQSRLMGRRPYPYLLHRAHETAVVSLDEKAQVTQMIAQELRQLGAEVGEISYKQSAKDLPGKTRHQGPGKGR